MSWLRNPDPPNLGQIWDEMGSELSFWTLETSSWGFKTLRIFLDRSQPPQLNVLIDKNDQHLAQKVEILVKTSNWPGNRTVELGPRGPMRRPMGALRGPMELQGGPMGPPALFPFVGP